MFSPDLVMIGSVLLFKVISLNSCAVMSVKLISYFLLVHNPHPIHKFPFEHETHSGGRSLCKRVIYHVLTKRNATVTVR